MIGIYALYWPSTGNIYIGQSINVKERTTEHIRKMRNNTHDNYKVQKEYKLYGIPEIYTLEECAIGDLDYNEIIWINEFNSTNIGLNITNGGTSGRGVDSGGSKYTKRQILKAFSLLYSTTSTYHSIGTRVSMDSRAVGGISQGLYHLWLSEEYPTKYKSMLSNAITRRKENTYTTRPNKKYPELMGPDGSIYKITTTVKDFCRNNELLNIGGVSGVYGLLRGEKISHLGFTLVDVNMCTHTTEIVRPNLIGPNSEVYVGIVNISEFCRSNTILKEFPNAANSISKVFRGACAHYRGFKLEKTPA